MRLLGRFFENLQEDVKAFAWWLLLLSLFRLAFIAIYSGQLDGVYGEIPAALLLGLRLSLKTAGYICLVGFVLASLPQIFLAKWRADVVRKSWHYLAIFFFTICFMARIPYYKVFNAAFNMMLINGAHDDKYAILMTAIQEYQLLWRLPVAFVLATLLCCGFRVWMRYIPVQRFAALKRPKIVGIATIIFVPILVVFTRYGGAFNYAHSINWESAARLKSNLLNEAILDDGQALYRVYASKKLLDKLTNINISKDELQKKIALTGGDAQQGTISSAYLHRVAQPRLQHQPHNVIILLGESFGDWPLQEQYRKLGLAERTLALQNSDRAASIGTMLAHGTGTIAAVNGLVTGVADTGLYENHQPLSLKSKYETGSAYIMKQLGYKTVFWYGGFSGWQNIKNFVLAQSFDEFHCADEFTYSGGNSWGCSDEVLLKEVAKYIAAEQAGEKAFHIVLTTSNHPPYGVDVDALGFPRERVRAALPADIGRDDKTLTELGHIWYADQTMGAFIAQVEKEKQDSLFIITGDHSERFSFAKEQQLRTLSAIPCIFYGAGVRRDLFAADSVGTHLQIAGTLAEMLAPTGFTYSALLPSMFTAQKVFNHRLYAQDGHMAEIKTASDAERKLFEAYRTVSAWRVQKGDGMK